MRYHDDGFSVNFVELFQDIEHVLRRLTVEVSDGLVSEDNLRIVDKRSRYRNSLFLSAGDFAWKFIHLFCDAETAEELYPIFMSRMSRLTAERLRETDVIDNAEGRDEVKRLEDHADPCLVKLHLFFSGHLGKGFFLDDDIPVCWSLKSGNRIQKRRFPATRRSVNDDVFLWVDVEIGFLERADFIRLALIVDDLEMRYCDDWFGHANIIPSFCFLRRALYCYLISFSL